MLVYLLARTARMGGMAVVAPVSGPLRALDLPRLEAGPGTPVTRYAKAYDVWYRAANSAGDEASAWRGSSRKLTRGCDEP